MLQSHLAATQVLLEGCSGNTSNMHCLLISGMFVSSMAHFCVLFQSINPLLAYSALNFIKIKIFLVLLMTDVMFLPQMALLSPVTGSYSVSNTISMLYLTQITFCTWLKPYATIFECSIIHGSTYMMLNKNKVAPQTAPPCSCKEWCRFNTY